MKKAYGLTAGETGYLRRKHVWFADRTSPANRTNTVTQTRSSVSGGAAMAVEKTVGRGATVQRSQCELAAVRGSDASPRPAPSFHWWDRAGRGAGDGFRKTFSEFFPAHSNRVGRGNQTPPVVAETQKS